MDDTAPRDNVISDVEYHRQLRRAAQRECRARETSSDRDTRRRKDSKSRKTARASLSEEQRITIRRTDTAARAIQRNLTDDLTRARIRFANTEAHRASHSAHPPTNARAGWWDRVAVLNRPNVAEPLRLRWNRTCRICGITVCSLAPGQFPDFIYHHRLRLRPKGHPLSTTTAALSSRVELFSQ